MFNTLSLIQAFSPSSLNILSIIANMLGILQFRFLD